MNGCRPFQRLSSWWCAGAAGLLLTCAASAQAQGAPPPLPSIRVINDAAGSRLQVEGRDVLVRGMNWDYIPIGTNYSYDFWGQPDDMIKAALAREMPLMKSMGVNAIRMYVGIPPRWVRYIYETYGIWSILNHALGRYGFTFDGVWTPVVDYSNPKLCAVIEADFLKTVKQFEGTPGVLMWLLGNENNYGLSWKSFEIEALPVGERDTARAKHLYAFFGQVIDAVHAVDTDRPVAMANGDLQYIDLIAAECKNLDIFGTNVYRGISARDLFQVVHDKLGKPIVFTEFGSDAFNAREVREDQGMQARYLIGQWHEIYEMTAGKGRVGNAIGGMIFQWSDGWWKFGQESRLDIHDSDASWPNGGYDDLVAGQNNMNEEWWGICAKGPADGRGLYDLYPRAAYYSMQKVFALDPYAASVDTNTIRAHFSGIDAASAVVAARGNQAALSSSMGERVRVSGLRLHLETITTSADGTEPPTTPPAGYVPPPVLGFDQMQSFYADIEAKPAPNVTGTLTLNMLGHIPTNPIDEIYYESPKFRPNGRNMQVYRSTLSWDDPAFRLEGFYHGNHFHWGYEGDFFGLYREANYGLNTDVYNAMAPVGFEIEAKQKLAGLKLAFGPELWWGANPSLILKYRRKVASFDATGMFQEEIAQQGTAAVSNQISRKPTRRATLYLASQRGPFDVEAGGIWANQNRVGDPFQIARRSAGASPYVYLLDKVYRSDAFGARMKLSMQRGKFRWYGQAARMGLVADGGPTQVVTFTTWSLKDAGTGNQTNVLSGFTWNTGNFQIGPNFLWQKPTVGPIPNDPEAPGRKRDIIDDPFAVRANREMFAAELVLTHDPTPATWMGAWDNDVREDAKLATSWGFVYRHLPTTMDASLFISPDANGVNQTFPFPNATPARDLWEARLRAVSRISQKTRVLANLYVGTGEPNGDNPRLVNRWGAEARLTSGTLSMAGALKVNDWGPYDFHRDFNLTFPIQVSYDVARTLGTPRWFSAPETKIGVRGIYRTLNQYSPRYTDITGLDGFEYEIRSYLHLTL